MSDRDDFLRLLFAGPLVAPPAVATAMAESDYLSGEVMIFDDITWFAPSNAVVFNCKNTWASDEVCNVYSIPAPASSNVPNRLFGAAINEDGEAV